MDLFDQLRTAVKGSGMARKIWVVGSAHIDHSFVVDRLLTLGTTVATLDYHRDYGGKGLNQAVAAHKLGGEVRFLACVGRDPEGEAIVDFLKQSGLGLSGIQRTRKASTGLAIVLITRNGGNSILVHSGADLDLRVDNRLDVRSGDLLLVQCEISKRSVEQAILRAKKADATIVLNASPVMAWTRSLLRHVDFLIVNELELAKLSGHRSHNARSILYAAKSLSRFSDASGMTVVVTRGSKGALVCSDGTHSEIPGVEVGVVDTSGAGDAFLGAFATSYICQNPAAKAAKFANLCAAISVTRRGTSGAAPTVAEVTAWSRRLTAPRPL
jgi:ribokinase